MKKAFFPILLLAASLLLPGANDKFSASAGAALLAPGDAGFKELYGEALLSPEIKLTYDLMPHFYLWLAASAVSASGSLPVLEDETKATQTFLSLGAGWETRRMGRLQADVAAALLLAGSREQAMGATNSKWAPGFDVRAGLRYFLGRKFFAGLTLGYAGAWTTVETGAREKDIILGGLRLGGSLGIRF